MLEVFKPHINRKEVGVWLCFAAKRHILVIKTCNMLKSAYVAFNVNYRHQWQKVHRQKKLNTFTIFKNNNKLYKIT